MGSNPWVPGLWGRGPRLPNTHFQFSGPESLCGRPRTKYLSPVPQEIWSHIQSWELTLTFYTKMEKRRSGSHSELRVPWGQGIALSTPKCVPPQEASREEGRRRGAHGLAGSLTQGGGKGGVSLPPLTGPHVHTGWRQRSRLAREG